MAKPLSPLLPPDSILTRDTCDATRLDERRASPRATALLARPEGGMPALLSSHLTLASGQSFHAYACRGTVIHIERGSVVLTTAPRWLAASFWRNTVLLTAGQVYVTQTSGWLTLSAEAGARLTLRDGVAEMHRSFGLRSYAARLWQIVRASLES
ncbi:hypothetical protein [Pandoraea apista]|uniref:DUF2917 domain-containing protein n=1 Tax=Pandoraea apista TaxID=93218 RepID=A0A5E5P5A4_9BURK|nr:hypothetical protein [Pandoraea apista]VVG70979.1 hypothetical protein PAP18089_01951 [Pandoraea apista]